MEHTEKYQLSQWSMGDRIRMEDFNGDNQKIDAALGTLAETVGEHTEELTKCGNCQIYTAEYVGTGKNSPLSHTFPHKPWFIFINDLDGGRTAVCWRHTVINPDPSRSLLVTWEERAITWYCSGSTDVGMNYPNRHYRIMAFLDMDN